MATTSAIALDLRDIPIFAVGVDCVPASRFTDLFRRTSSIRVAFLLCHI